MCRVYCTTLDAFVDGFHFTKEEADLWYWRQVRRQKKEKLAVVKASIRTAVAGVMPWITSIFSASMLAGYIMGVN